MKIHATLCLALLGLVHGLASAAPGAEPTAAPTNPFHNRLAPAPVGGAFQMDGFIVWGGSVIRHDDGRYYMFASRWPRRATMKSWVTHSEIVLASAAKPEGPYEFEQVVLPQRGADFWDGKMTHNPTIRRHQGKYLLYYIGTTYDFETPADPISRETYEKVWNCKRLGLATADSPFGPWQRADQPILEPRPDAWDAAITSNPSPVIHEDGSVTLIYKSAPVPYPERNENRALYFGVAKAPHYLGPYRRLNDGQKIEVAGGAHVEDPYVWEADGLFHMIAKVFSSEWTGETNAGIYTYSKDAITWTMASHPQAYSRKVHFSDGSTRTQKRLERPQVLLKDGRPTHLFCATIDSTGIYNLVIPVLPQPAAQD